MQKPLDRTIKVSLGSLEGLDFLLTCTTDTVVSLHPQPTTDTLIIRAILEDIVEQLHLRSETT